MTSLVRQDLAAAYDILERKGWCRGGSFASGSVCLEAAVAMATMKDARLWSLREHDGPPWVAHGSCIERYIDPALAQRFFDAGAALINALPDLDKDFMGAAENGNKPALWWWNDRPGRTVEEVKALIKLAMEAEAE